MTEWLKEHKVVVLVFIVVSGLVIMWVKTQMETRRPPSNIEISEAVGPGGEPGGAEAVPVNAFRVKPVYFQDNLLAMGTIKSAVEIELKFEMEGKVASFRFREGDKVKKGNIIAQLEQKDAYFRVKQAKLELDQYRKLYEVGAVLKSKLEQAKIQADMAKSVFEKTNLRAPRDGVISSKNIKVGEYITPQKKAAVLIGQKDVVVEFGIIEKDIEKILIGQKVIANVDTYPGIDFKGKISDISKTVRGKSKTLTIKAKLDNPKGILLPGMFARATIAIYEASDALVIPSASLSRQEGGYQVLVISDRKQISIKNVNVKYLTQKYAQISQGLSNGELVVVEKPEELKEGSSVEIIQVREYKQ
ncbi:efflux RND transporter periplasmic adaptor subunit [bacterium]|nr:efflux RND transporter periplasmic adaptor subunit [bacterium]